VSQNSFGLPTSFFWDFGNGTTSTQALPPGTTLINNGTTDSIFTITLVAINACGTDTFTQNVLVKPNTIIPFVNASPLVGCAPLTVTFQNFTMDATTYSWNFGDGNLSNQASPSHTYLQPGNYTAFMQASNGCSVDTLSIPVQVFSPPQVSFLIQNDSLCLGSTFQFINTSVNLNNTVWNFGNGQTSLLTNPSIIFTTSGTQLVSLIGSDQTTGCTDTAFGTVWVSPVPNVIPTADPGIGCIPHTVTFADQGSGSLFYTWNFADGSTSVFMPTTHTFTSAGTYPVSLIGENIFGCRDTGIVSVTAHPLPVAAFDSLSETICNVPVTIDFNNTSQNAVAYEWNFGNNQTSTQINPNAQYVAPGTYTIELIAYNQFGCTDTATQSVTIFDAALIPDFSVTPLSGCSPLTVQVTDASTGAQSYLWNFGDGNTSTQVNPTHTYTTSGNFIITLTVGNNVGCTETLNADNAISVYPKPVAGFTATPDPVSFLSPVILITDESIGGSSITYTSDPDWLVPVTDNYFFINADGPGFLEITQIVTSTFGCSDTAVNVVQVYLDESTFYVPNAFSPDGNITNEVFKPIANFVTDYTMQIFTRWGELIFETNNIDEGWDGTYMNKGGKRKVDVYVYKIAFRDVLGNPNKRTGRVTLLGSDELK
jgi:gliding motility-associated-like protein